MIPSRCPPARPGARVLARRAGRLDIHPIACDSVSVVSEKYERLRGLLWSYGSCLVAYSGGVDSVFLAYVAHDVLGAKSLAVIADSPSLPRREFEQALALARQFQFPVRVIRTREFEDPSYLANPANRCYFCKHELFSQLAPLAKAENLAVIAHGENASDLGDYRPGLQAAAQFQVRAPLKEAGLTKAEIRALSAQLGLPTADKPQMACLSSRVPYGEPVTPEKLKMIEQAEDFLRDLGFYDVRVRHHELPSAERGLRNAPPVSGPINSALRTPHSAMHLARIEVGAGEMPKLLENGLSSKVAEALREIGYAHVTLDLQGYRRGSANEVLQPPGAPGAAPGQPPVPRPPNAES